jgi:hypothetical protein
MPAAAFRRIPVQPQAQQQLEKKLFPAPTRGWIANENLAAAKPGGALRLENIFPTEKSVRLRGGSERFATVGSSTPVTSLWNFKTGTSERFFAATETAIYDITAPADPNVSPAPDVSGQTSGYYSTAPFATIGGNFLVAVNGTDYARIYNGTRWEIQNGLQTYTISYDTETGNFTKGQQITGSISGAKATILDIDDDGPQGTLYIQSILPGPVTYALNFDTQTVNFTVGATVTGATSTAHGVIQSQVDVGATGTLYLRTVVGTFTAGETITGSSGGSAKVNGTISVSDAGLFQNNETLTDPLGGSARSSGVAIAYGIPPITGVDTSTLSHVNVYRSRLYFVERGTFSVWYPPVDVLGGAATEFALKGIFLKGGSLLFTATWSLDAGDGVDDKLVFVTTEGEAAVYEGGFPGDNQAWSLVGRYDLAPPMGKNAVMRAGGELLIATTEGIIPISAAITKDTAALSLAAITKTIEPEWKKEVAARSNLPWDMLKWPNHNMAIVALPTEGGGASVTIGPNPYCFVVNVQTGGWTKYTDWDTRCLGLFGEWAYFGTSTGTVMKAEVSGADDGHPYECAVVWQFDHLGDIGPTHLAQQLRTTFLASVPFTPRASLSTNYVIKLPAAPPAAANNPSGSEWDVGLWDVALWDAQGQKSVTTRWTSAGKTGFCIAPQVQVTCGQQLAPDAELISLELTYEHGGLVV